MKELLVLVPGLARQAQHHQQETFARGLMHASEKVVLKRQEEGDIPPNTVCLVGTESDGSELTYHIAETYWNDLSPSLTEQPLKTRLLRGCSLFSYWTFSGIWKNIRGRKYLTISIIISTLALAFWYYGILALFVKALQADPGNEIISKQLNAFFSHGAIKWVGSWKVWAIATALMGIIPVTRMVDIMDFAKRYISDETDSVDDPSLRLQIVKRIRDQIINALNADTYDRITIISHSFGSVAAVDVMADIPFSNECGFRMITLGSPMELLAARAPWLNEEKNHCLNRPELQSWVDVNSTVDWIATGADLPETPKTTNKTVRPTGTLLDRVVANVHSRYFDNQDVASIVLR